MLNLAKNRNVKKTSLLMYVTTLKIEINLPYTLDWYLNIGTNSCFKAPKKSIL